jgi:2-oxo-4-hydroxy-4-carboxy--5-ureidoimidazoline (OHCU) decarboxylase
MAYMQGHFESGAAAAGIDRLPEEEFARFIARLAAAWRNG